MNYGLIYQRRYFDKLQLNKDGELANTKDFKGGSELLEKQVPPFSDSFKGVDGFQLKTVYPGLLCGIGYQHEINPPKTEDDPGLFFQLGMYFDHTTGLPVIPGSSIKGALRAAIKEWDYLEADPKKTWATWDRDRFIQQVFEGDEQNIYQRDIFLDAIPIECERHLFGEDYITPHESPLKNPTPIRFLRVNPDVTYQFRFMLRDTSDFKAADKLQLFREIILEFGLGAKTNIGYGRFVK